MDIHISRNLKEELAWAIDKQFQVISNVLLFKTVISLRNLRYQILLLPICSCIHFKYDSTLLGHTGFTLKVFLHEISLLLQGSCIAIDPEYLTSINVAG